jgi:hypothetical protein
LRKSITLLLENIGRVEMPNFSPDGVVEKDIHSKLANMLANYYYYIPTYHTYLPTYLNNESITSVRGVVS